MRDSKVSKCDDGGDQGRGLFIPKTESFKMTFNSFTDPFERKKTKKQKAIIYGIVLVA